MNYSQTNFEGEKLRVKLLICALKPHQRNWNLCFVWGCFRLILSIIRVIPNRRAQPEAYRLFLELMRQYYLSFSLVEAGSRREM